MLCSGLGRTCRAGRGGGWTRAPGGQPGLCPTCPDPGGSGPGRSGPEPAVSPTVCGRGGGPQTPPTAAESRGPFFPDQLSAGSPGVPSAGTTLTYKGTLDTRGPWNTTPAKAGSCATSGPRIRVLAGEAEPDGTSSAVASPRPPLLGWHPGASKEGTDARLPRGPGRGVPVSPGCTFRGLAHRDSRAASLLAAAPLLPAFSGKPGAPAPVSGSARLSGSVSGPRLTLTAFSRSAGPDGDGRPGAGGSGRADQPGRRTERQALCRRGASHLKRNRRKGLSSCRAI